MKIYYIDKTKELQHNKEIWEVILLAYYMGCFENKELPDFLIKKIKECLVDELRKKGLLIADPMEFAYICYKGCVADNVYRGASFISDKESIVIFPYMDDYYQMLSIAIHEIIHIQFEKSQLYEQNGMSEEEYVIAIENEIMNVIKEKFFA